MKIAAALLLFVASASAIDAERYARAIYIAEGGSRARVPYGILTVKVRDKAHARRVCLNTINNTHARWLEAGQPGDFTEFLGRRYCPPSVDPEGHRNWVRNVRKIL